MISSFPAGSSPISGEPPSFAADVVVAFGTASELDSALPITPEISMTIGVSAETDTALPITPLSFDDFSFPTISGFPVGSILGPKWRVYFFEPGTEISDPVRSATEEHSNPVVFDRFGNEPEILVDIAKTYKISIRNQFNVEKYLIESYAFPGIFAFGLDNTYYINKAADFPVQNGSTITLGAVLNFVIGASFSTAKNFIVENGAGWTSNNIFGPRVTYTGTNPMFTGEDVSFNIKDTSISSPNATTFDLSETLPGSQSILVMESVQGIACTKIAEFDSMTSIDIINSSFLDADDGIELLGSGQGIMSIDKFAAISTSSSFTGIDFGTTVQQNLNLQTLTFVAPAGAVGLSGLTGSGNVQTGFIGNVSSVAFVGGMTDLSGISESDIRWEFINSPPVPNSSIAADLHLTSSRTVPIVTAGVFEDVNGTSWVSSLSERFSTDNAGTVTYDYERDSSVFIIITATVEKVGGGTDQLALRISVDGVDIEASQSVTDNKTPTSLTSALVTTISNGEEIKARVANIDSTADIIMSECKISVINGF